MKFLYQYDKLMHMTRFFTFILLGFLVGAAPALAAPSKVPPPSKDYSIVILGDQMSDDIDFMEEDTLSHVLEIALAKRAGDDRLEVKDITVTNLSYDGLSIMTATAMLEEVKELEPDIVVIQLGLNDVLAGTEVHILERALANLITEIRRFRSYPVLIGDVPPKEVPYTYASHYNVMLRQVANAYQAQFVSKYVRALDGKIELFLADGRTPNEDGKLVLAKNLSPKLSEVMEVIYKGRVSHYNKLKKKERAEEEQRRYRKREERKRRLQEEHNRRYGIVTPSTAPVPADGVTTTTP